MWKYKVYVYAIAKNEEKNVAKWLKSMSEADGIYVMLDGTSTDNTERLLIEGGAKVTKKLINPWRFDVARNESLKLVPKDADICVCTDLDEVFEPGWRKLIEDNWKPDTNLAWYNFYHNAGSPDQVPSIFKYCKIHDRKNFKWKWPIHEYIVWNNKKQKCNEIVIEDLLLKHYPDLTKFRPYFKMLEDGVKESPNDPRLITLLCEEYIKMNEYEKAENLLIQLLKKNRCKNNSDLCLAYKFLIQIYKKTNLNEKAKEYCYIALSKNDKCRVFYGELGEILVCDNIDSELGIAYLNKCLNIKNDVISAREYEWKKKFIIHNLISIGFWNLKDYESALKNVEIAIEECPKEDKMYNVLLTNKDIYLKNIEERKNTI